LIGIAYRRAVQASLVRPPTALRVRARFPSAKIITLNVTSISGPSPSVRRAARAATPVALTQRSESFRSTGIDSEKGHHTPCLRSLRSSACARRRCGCARDHARADRPSLRPRRCGNHTVARVTTQHCPPWPLARSRCRPAISFAYAPGKTGTAKPGSRGIAHGFNIGSRPIARGAASTVSFALAKSAPGASSRREAAKLKPRNLKVSGLVHPAEEGAAAPASRSL
jgi:hypothetical protein